MYTQLQQKAKEYIIGTLNQISNKWKFDIVGDDNPIIMGSGPYDSKIRTSIDEIHSNIPNELIDKIWPLCKFQDKDKWCGYAMMHFWFNKVFDIYKVKGSVVSYSPQIFEIHNKDSTKLMFSFMYMADYDATQYMSPFVGKQFETYIAKNKVVPSLLLLLDPIMYFRQYSIIIKKYPELGGCDIIGIYGALLEYFPEMNAELVIWYWALCCMSQDLCYDVVVVIVGILIDLYA